MKRKKDDKPGYARLLDAWGPPTGAGDPIGCVATSFTFSSAFFEEECLGRFVQLETDAAEDGAAFLIEREEKFAQLACAAALVDQRHAQGLRSLRWDLLAARLPAGILHAKISLLLWTNCARLIIGSANLTEDGYRRNQEVFGVLDYHPGSSASLRVLDDVLEFLDAAVAYVDPDASEPDVAVKRWRRFLERVRAASRQWGSATPARGATLGIHAILTGPNRRSVFEGMRAQWRESAPPREAWVISPFFDPPEAPNAPAREIWKYLRQRGEAAVVYAAMAEDIEGTEQVRLLAPESLRWHPANRPVEARFERLQTEPTRPLHAKCLWFEGEDWLVYVIGSSNFTSAGLGVGTTKNLEANLAYSVNFKRNADALRECRSAWLKSTRIKGEPVLIPTGEMPEDSETSGAPLLHPAFGSVTAAREVSGEAWVEFTFNGAPPPGWQVLADDQPEVVVDEDQWQSKGQPPVLRLAWTNQRLPVGFRVTRAGVEGAAWWPVNVRDSASLPPPAELHDLPLEVLIEVLTSAMPLHVAMKRWLSRKAANAAAGIVLVDPHERVDTSAFLLQRTRRVAWALSGLRTRLERPVASMEALEWRLRGPVGVGAIRRAIANEARSPEERVFLLAELMLELSRVRPMEAPGTLTATQVKTALQEVMSELKEMLKEGTQTVDPAFRLYLEAARGAVS